MSSKLKLPATPKTAVQPIDLTHFTVIDGSTDILLIAPHACVRNGEPKDDENTGPITELVARQIGCSAIINTHFHKPDDKKYTKGHKPKKNEYPHGLVYGNLDLNVIGDAEQVPGYLDAIRAVVDSPGKTIVIWIHGADDKKAKARARNFKYPFRPAEIHAFIGYGQGDEPIVKAKESRETADLTTVERFRDALIRNGMNAVKTDENSTNYRGRSEAGMNQWFLNQGYTLDLVESIQLEIRKDGFRDLHHNIEKTAGILIEALSQEALVPVISEETEADDDLVNLAFNHLRGIFAKHIHEAMLHAGRYLVRTFFGTYENARGWKKIREQSFNRLKERLNSGSGDAPQKTWIYDAVKLAVDDHYFRMEGGPIFRTYGKLGHSQKVLLTHVKDTKKKWELVEKAVEKPQTVKQFRESINAIRKKKRKSKRKGGHSDWTEPKNNVSFCSGCENDCVYCYGRYFAARRGQIEPDNWSEMKIREHDVRRGRALHKGRIGFPSTHDILPSNLDASLNVLGKLLLAGNSVLVISKPRMNCIKRICSACEFFKDKILFRFTIGSMNDALLGFWEPQAPLYRERKFCLAYARNRGFQTSISMEPMLDTENIDVLINDLKPLVSDKIWLGTMEYLDWIKTRVAAKHHGEIGKIESGQAPEKLLAIYNRYIDDPVIEWKTAALKRFSSIIGLRIPLEGNGEMRLDTANGLQIANGYNRVVVGGRGPYIEFDPSQIVGTNLHKPKQKHIYYEEWRSNDDSNVKVYEQKRTVKYADYKPGLYYVSPSDLTTDGQAALEQTQKK